MGTNCAPLATDLFFILLLERLHVVSIQTDIVKAFNSTSRYQNDLLNNDNPYFAANSSSDISH